MLYSLDALSSSAFFFLKINPERFFVCFCFVLLLLFFCEDDINYSAVIARC